MEQKIHDPRKLFIASESQDGNGENNAAEGNQTTTEVKVPKMYKKLETCALVAEAYKQASNTDLMSKVEKNSTYFKRVQLKTYIDTHYEANVDNFIQATGNDRFGAAMKYIASENLKMYEKYVNDWKEQNPQLWSERYEGKRLTTKAIYESLTRRKEEENNDQ